jgi:hypothetical protein
MKLVKLLTSAVIMRLFMAVREVSAAARSYFACIWLSTLSALMVSALSSDSTRMPCFTEPSRRFSLT